MLTPVPETAMKKILFSLVCLLPLLAFSYLTYTTQFKCGDPREEIELEQSRKDGRYRRTKTTFTPSRDWKGCLLTIRIERNYSTGSPEITERTFRVKNGKEPVEVGN